MFKRFASAFLAICLITSILPGAFASDIGSHWAKNDILLLSKKGIMTGDGKGNYRPDAKITRAEFAALLNRTFGYLKEGDIRFSDVTYNNDWKSQAITRAATFGYMLGSDGKANPNGMISRQEASAMLVRILRLPIKETGSTGFKDESSIATWAKNYIATAAKYGIVTAMPNGNFDPASSLSRAQAATFISRAMGELYNKAGSYTGSELSGNVTINTPGVTLENTTIEGNLYLTEGIGSGSVTLKNVRVLGMTIVAGGGTDNGVTAENSTFSDKLMIIYPSGYLSGIRFALKGSSSTQGLEIKAPAVLDTTALNSDAAGIKDLSFDTENTEISLNGNFGSISLNNPKTKLSINSGTVSSLTLAEGTFTDKYQITVGAGGIIGELNIKAPSSITGSGTLSNVIVNSSDSIIGPDVTVNINHITLLNGVSIKVGNNTLTPFDESAKLSALVLKSADGSETTPMDTFSASTTSYQAYSDADSIRVYPTAGDGSNYKIKVNGNEVSSGNYITISSLNSNPKIQIQVSCDEKNTIIYTVTMAKLVEPELSSLTVYNTDNKIYPLLNPKFDPSVLSYSVTTSGTNILIKASTDSAGNTVKIDDNDAKKGTAENTVYLTTSQKEIKIVVSNGYQSKTYKLELDKQQTAGSMYCSNTNEGSGTSAEWTITIKNPSEGDVFTIADQSFIVGKTDTDCEQISRKDALTEIAKEYADNKTFDVSTSDGNLIFANKTAGAISSTSSVACNIGTVTKTDGLNRKNGTSTITVKALPTSGNDPNEIKVNSKTYRLCTKTSDVKTEYDISLVGVTTTSQVASLLEKKLSGSTTGAFLTSLSGSSIIVSSGEIEAPTITYDSTLFTITKAEGNAARPETFIIKLPDITEGMKISITVNGSTTDFQAHDSNLVSEDNPAGDIVKAFYSSAFSVTAKNTNTVIFKSRLLGSAGNSQEINTSGSIVSEAEQTTIGKDTKMGTSTITVSKVPKFGDTLKIDSTMYTFSNISGTNKINISDSDTIYEVSKAIKNVIGDTASLSGNRITVKSQTAQPPAITFTAS